uniref:Uncharacterized protein n=1 Tax=Oryza nivara TaxID=4536 RepID=A0A0E0FJV5_ORYNI
MESNVKQQQQQVGKGIKRKKGGGQEERQMHGWIIKGKVGGCNFQREKEKKAAYAHTHGVHWGSDRSLEWLEREREREREMQDTHGKRTNRQQRMSICQEGNVEWWTGWGWGFIRSCGRVRRPCLLGRQHLAGLG